ncbi:hypothetical protein VTK26DRAFT_463 [Humicola hyalothermophila]
MSNTQAFDDKPDFALSSQPEPFDEPIFDKFEDMNGQDTMVPSAKLVPASADIPELPAKSALRRSRLLLDSHGLKLGGAVEAGELGQATTPHDVYLSSEEDASSDADDFSDYDYDSSVEDPMSPTRRDSREDTARVVSVVFAGKPSLVDLPASRKRPISSSSMGANRTRSSTESSLAGKPPTVTSATAQDRPVTPASTVSSQSQSKAKPDGSTTRKSLLLSEILGKKKPPFLSIDPYANGSSYTLNIPKALDSLEGEHAPQTPRTPTQILRGVTRTFSLARKRSRPAMSAHIPQSAASRIDTPVDSPTVPASLSRASIQSPATVVHAADRQSQYQTEADYHHDYQHQYQQPMTPQTPITYNDILRAVKRSATVVGGPPLPPGGSDSDIMSPMSPNTQAATATAPVKKGILSGLSARRKSIKLTGKPF